MIIKNNKYLKTTVQESKGKYTTTIPTGLAKLIGLHKGDKFIWNLSENKVDIKNLKFVIKIVKGDHGYRKLGCFSISNGYEGIIEEDNDKNNMGNVGM